MSAYYVTWDSAQGKVDRGHKDKFEEEETDFRTVAASNDISLDKSGSAFLGRKSRYDYLLIKMASTFSTLK